MLNVSAFLENVKRKQKEEIIDDIPETTSATKLRKMPLMGF